MTPDDIAVTNVRAALNAVRTAGSLTRSPLLQAASVDRLLDESGLEDTPAARASSLAAWLEQTCRQRLDELRREHETGTANGARDSSAAGGSPAPGHELAALARDFEAGDAAREAWGALYARNFGGPDVTIADMAEALHVSPKTVRRRIARGMTELTAVLRERERLSVSARAQRHALPTPLTRFIGRERELADVRDRLSNSPLVTLVGAGGIGKSRLALDLAIAMAPDYADGVYFVDLSPATDGPRVLADVADAVGVKDPGGGRLAQAIAGHLSGGRSLLLLDNCEHVRASCAELVAEIRQHAPTVQVLTTSRERLGTADEDVFHVPPLGLPKARGTAESTQLLQYDAIRLFLDRASRPGTTRSFTDDDLTTVERICRQLDGIPLAIELAAGRAWMLSLGQIAERLDDRFRFLMSARGGGRPLHQTLEAAMDWSYELLELPERALLQRLSVFAASWSIEDARAVCVGHGIVASEVPALVTQLERKSLVQRAGRAGDVRHHMLETIRAYARDRLARSGDARSWRDRHMHWCADTLQSRAPSADDAPSSARLAAMDNLYPDVATALDHAAAEGHAEVALRLAADLGPFWRIRCRFAEGRAFLERTLALDAGAAGRELRWRVLALAGELAWQQGDLDAARQVYDEALAIATELQDERGRAETLRRLGNLADEAGQAGSARELHEEALQAYRDMDDEWGIAASLNNLGLLSLHAGDHDTAQRQFEDCLERFRAQKADWAVGITLYNLGNAAFDAGGYDRSCDCYAESLTIARGLDDDVGTALALRGLGNVAAETGDLGTAREQYGQAFGLVSALEDRKHIAETLESLAEVEQMARRLPAAARLFAAADALRRETGMPVTEKDRSKRESDLEDLRRALGDGLYHAAWFEGERLGWRSVLQADG